jgi:hypothetical protein
LAKAKEKCKRSEIYSDLSSGTEDKRNRSSLKTFIRPNCSNCDILMPLPEFKNSSFSVTDLLTVSSKTNSAATQIVDCAKRGSEKEQEESSVSNTNHVNFITPERSSQRQTDNRLSKLTPVVETASKKDRDQGLSLFTFFVDFFTVSIFLNQITYILKFVSFVRLTCQGSYLPGNVWKVRRVRKWPGNV